MSEHRECLFLPGRGCNLKVDEIPLEICRLCLEAFRDYASVREASYNQKSRSGSCAINRFEI